MSPSGRPKGLKIDFHTHTNFSSDGDMSPEGIIRAAKNAGLDGIAVTDHNTIRGGKRAEKLAGNDFIVFVGAEIKTADGEIIGINLRGDIPPDLSPEETCRRIKNQGGFVIIPHPFDKTRSGLGDAVEKIVEYIDAVEVFNARSPFDRFNKKAADFACKKNLPRVAGSDSHFEDELGYAHTMVYSDRNKKNIR